ncbi:hypothetical protein TWF718_009242 [Orbilia javanica]|uniref:N-acetyltransferase domain-containing protein n=1 Tax=Orbilia javanica TaxID=47235 RepID=A0AAN8MUP6_9PEZI
MSLHPATPSSHPTILELHNSSLPDHIYANFIHPFRHLHPVSFTTHTSLSTSKKFTSPSQNEYNLITTSPSQPQSAKPTAWSFWRRNIGQQHSSKISTYKTTASSISDGDSQISSLSSKDDAVKYPSLSAPRQALCNYHTLNDTLKYFSNEHYYLSHLLVHPDHKRKGYGTLLTLWGLYHAAREGVPVYLTASIEGERLYKKLGFRVIGEKTFPSIDEMSDEDRQREEDILGKEVMEEQFNIVRPKIMVWEGTIDDDIFKDKDVMEKILAVPCDIRAS